jgi:beta-1,4-mannosyl-glycoprotein beta-1,4-N-acetylglucosaminyltransferase
MLKLRLHELYDVVDYFVLVESTKTFTYSDKKLHFSDNKEEFKRFLNKIIHVTVDDMPPGNDNWKREIHQRNSIARGIEKLKLEDTDYILISDVDEIPDKNRIKELRERTVSYQTPLRLFQHFYYYNVNCKSDNLCTTAVLSRKLDLKKYNSIDCMVRANLPVTPNNWGWHFSYFGDINFIVNKIKSFSHSEYNLPQFTNPEEIFKKILQCKDLFDRDESNHRFYYIDEKDNPYLPENYKMLCT